ncbi:MAG: hypothetical protein JXJ17_18730 [Anaerolineae bacterium]|nr:hypothetical protein [Anaerolineae bacterium]
MQISTASSQNVTGCCVLNAKFGTAAPGDLIFLHLAVISDFDFAGFMLSRERYLFGGLA